MIRRPPRSTLFPYTDALPISLTLDGTNSYVVEGWVVDPGPALDEHLDALERAAAPAGGIAGIVDRKSTRLNSSHANISYAVFCLKKKKRIIIKRVLENNTDKA